MVIHEVEVNPRIKMSQMIQPHSSKQHISLVLQHSAFVGMSRPHSVSPLFDKCISHISQSNNALSIAAAQSYR